jgi:uncharacterized protein (TIGR03067 family)
LKEQDKQLKNLRQEVARRVKDFKRQSLNQPLHRKVTIAIMEAYGQGRARDSLGRGLAHTALDLLQKAKGKEKDPRMAVWQIRLLLTLGRVPEAQEGVKDLEDALRRINQQKKPSKALLMARMDLEFNIPWCKVLVAAANGNYREADAALRKLIRNPQVTIPRPFLNTSAVLLLQGTSAGYLLNHNLIIRQGYIPYLQNIMRGSQEFLVTHLRRQADFQLLQALLALEHGETKKAATSLWRCLRLSQHLTYNPRPGYFRDLPTNYNDRLIAKNYLDFIERQRLHGRWKAASAEIDGRKATRWKKDGRWSRLVFHYRNYRTPETEGVFLVDPAGKLRVLNLTVLEGPGRGRIIPCIYYLKGDVLKVSFIARESGARVPPARAASVLGLLLGSPGLNPAAAATYLTARLLPQRPSGFKEQPHAGQVVIEYRREKD